MQSPSSQAKKMPVAKVRMPNGQFWPITIVTQMAYKDICTVTFDPNVSNFAYTAGDLIFIKVDHLQLFFSVDRLQNGPCVLVSGCGDASPHTFFSDNAIKALLSNKNITEWWTQNCCLIADKLRHLPIGLENNSSKIAWIKANTNRLCRRTKDVNKGVYFNFSVVNNPRERECFLVQREQAAAVHKPVLPAQLPFAEYMEDMAKHQYVMCPMGNGVDTHRFWEALCCGCIPIVRCPEAFLPTYAGTNYICLPGICYVSHSIVTGGPLIPTMSKWVNCNCNNDNYIFSCKAILPGRGNDKKQRRDKKLITFTPCTVAAVLIAVFGLSATVFVLLCSRLLSKEKRV